MLDMLFRIPHPQRIVIFSWLAVLFSVDIHAVKRPVGPECPPPQPAGDYAVMSVTGKGSRKQVLYQCQPHHIWKSGQSSISCERGVWGPGDSLSCKPLFGANRQKLTSSVNSRPVATLHLGRVVTPNVGTFIGQYRALFGGKAVLQFLGIRYGKKTARFERATEVDPTNKTFRTTSFSPACPQTPILPFSTQQTLLNQDEDCLFLNIYIPRLPRLSRVGKLPVLVFIHGGFFRQGAGGDIDGSTLSSFTDIVVVTVNYRLGFLAFLSTGTSDLPGNLNLWDLKLALEWIQRNIASFGGDPNKVTIAGQSAGGVLASHLAQSLQTKGLFAQAILQSGHATAPGGVNSNPSGTFDVVSESLSCSGSTRDRIVCLKNVPLAQLLAIAAPGALPLPLDAFSPVVDGKLITETPGEFLDLALSNRLPEDRSKLLRSRGYLVSSTSQEGTVQYAQLRDILNTNTAIAIVSGVIGQGQSQEVVQAAGSAIRSFYGQQFDLNDPEEDILSGIEILGDAALLVPELVISGLLSFYNVNTYALVFDFPWDPTTRVGPLFPAGDLAFPDFVETGSGHSTELYYMFGYPLDTRVMLYQTQPNFIEEDRRMARLMMSYIGNFVKTGNPNKGLAVPTKWDRFSAGSAPGDYSVFVLKDGMGDGNRNVINFNSGENNLWTNIVPSIFSG